MSYELNQTAAGRDVVPSPPRWKGTRSLDLVHRLNERCLELLAQAACDGEYENSIAMRQELRLWRSLDVATRRRVARLPFVIVDVHFTDIAWWEQVRDPMCGLQREAEVEGRRPSSQGEQLMHETLMFAWHMAQSDRVVSCLIVGMSREVSAAIGGLSTTDIRRIASTFTHDVGPRWGNCPDLWRNLILAAILLQANNLTNEPYIAYSQDKTRLMDYQEYGAQYLFGINYRL